VFESIDDPHWTGAAGAPSASDAAAFPLCVPSARYEPMRKITHPGEKIV
jgi:putative proteasome-type protease